MKAKSNAVEKTQTPKLEETVGDSRQLKVKTGIRCGVLGLDNRPQPR